MEKKQKLLWRILAGLSVAIPSIVAFVEAKRKKEKYSGLVASDIDMPGRATNMISFTLNNRTDSPQTVNLFNTNTLSNHLNPNVHVSSTPSLSFFTKTLGKQPKMMDRMEIKSANANQLNQQLVILARDANGQQVQKPVIPMTSAFQAQGSIAMADVSGLIMDGSTQINNYTVLPRTEVLINLWWRD
jgi:hypothetical protein